MAFLDSMQGKKFPIGDSADSSSKAENTSADDDGEQFRKLMSDDYYGEFDDDEGADWSDEEISQYEDSIREEIDPVYDEYPDDEFDASAEGYEEPDDEEFEDDMEEPKLEFPTSDDEEFDDPVGEVLVSSTPYEELAGAKIVPSIKEEPLEEITKEEIPSEPIVEDANIPQPKPEPALSEKKEEPPIMEEKEVTPPKTVSEEKLPYAILSGFCVRADEDKTVLSGKGVNVMLAGSGKMIVANDGVLVNSHCHSANLEVYGRIDGEVASEELVCVRICEGGKVVGNVCADQIFVEKGVVIGNLFGNTVNIIGGAVKGTVVAKEELTVSAGSKIKGNVESGHLNIDKEAMIEGSCKQYNTGVVVPDDIFN